MDKTILNVQLPVMEHFNTLQGEGAFTGHSAYFIRLGGCDVGCVWCDVKESWPIESHPQFSISEICSWAETAKGAIVVITGGEPAMHDLRTLTRSLKAANKRTHIETSGVYPLSGDWDWVCFSPKKFKKPHTSIYEKANELKVIINHKSDFDFAIEHAKQVAAGCKLYLQAEWDKRDMWNPIIVEFIKENPAWAMSLQSHKYLQIP